MNRIRTLIAQLAGNKRFHHLFPVAVFILFACGFYAFNRYQYVKDPQGNTATYTFRNTFLKGRYDQGIYRGVGTTWYKDGKKRCGWYPGAAVWGGIFWNLVGRPKEQGFGGTLFYLGFYIPSILAGMGFFYFFYRYALGKWGPGPAFFSMLSLVCFPPSFYYLTAFPYNLALVCMTGYMLLFEKRFKGRYLALGAIAFYESITYPTSFLFALYPLCSEAVSQYRARRFQPWPYIGYGLPFALGPLAFYSYLYLVTGDFLAYLHHQGQHYARTFGSPIMTVLDYFQRFPLNYPENLVAMLVGLYLVLFFTRKIGLPLWVYSLAVLSFSPLTGSLQCIYRHYLLVFPLHYLFGASSRHWSIKVVVAAICALYCVRRFFILYLNTILT